MLVVEEGAWTEPDAVEPYSVAQMERQYRNAGLTVALGRPSVAYTEGRGVGGGSEVNSGLYHRAPQGMLQRWSADYAVEDLSGESLVPFQGLVEEELSVAPWPDELPPSSDALRRGAIKLGWDGFDVPRWAQYRTDGQGRTTAIKQTMTRTYWPKALGAGVELRTGWRVRRLKLGDDVARAAVLDDVESGVSERIQVDQVFVCGGATQTPALLQRSGIRRNIGGNFSVHPTVKVVAEFDHEVNEPGDLPTYQVKEFAPWLSFGGSASRPALIGLALAGSWDRFGEAVQRWRQQTVYYAAIQSIGRGRVQALPGFRDPAVTYRLTLADIERLRSGLARLIHLMLAAGARRVYPSYAGAPLVTNREQAAAAVAGMSRANLTLMTVHLCGTVPLGEDRRRAGADSFGRVHGTRNVYVNDASLLPDAPGVNPQGTVMALAHRDVEHVIKNS